MQVQVSRYGTYSVTNATGNVTIVQIQVSRYVPLPWYAQPLGIIAVVAALTLIAGVC